jgi:hypothetical protein
MFSTRKATEHPRSYNLSAAAAMAATAAEAVAGAVAAEAAITAAGATAAEAAITAAEAAEAAVAPASGLAAAAAAAAVAEAIGAGALVGWSGATNVPAICVGARLDHFFLALRTWVRVESWRAS